MKLPRKTFFLQEGVPDNLEGKPCARVFLDDRLHAGCEVVQTLEAIDWPSARAQLPYFNTTDDTTA